MWIRRGVGVAIEVVEQRIAAATLSEAAAQLRELRPQGRAFVCGTFDPQHSAAQAVVLLGPERALDVASVTKAPSPSHVAAEHYREYTGKIQQATAKISATELEKVVLARALTLQAPATIDPTQVVACLAQAYPTCWTFYLDGLVGASPELLVRVQDGLVTSRVLAGTIRRAPGSEAKLASWLAGDDKNLREHEFARDSVAAALRPFCTAMNVPESPSVLHLPNVLHLASEITGALKPGFSALDLAIALHPSAAVCGTPTELARQTIAELEGLDRGHYAAPIGWVDAQGNGELAIALRCGQIHPDDPSRITLYAGAGIVADSDAAEEYAETESKLLPMLHALGYTHE
jgi:menaquinone-specific isochorismate synthase